MYKVNSKWVIVFTQIKVMSVIYVLGGYEAVEIGLVYSQGFSKGFSIIVYLCVIKDT